MIGNASARLGVMFATDFTAGPLRDYEKETKVQGLKGNGFYGRADLGRKK